ncbi:hypothetical protein SLNWT_4538 [Streptomyces albus]|uniref:Uncharacterized protein n=1 Tax=Streptomyces albus (strain ATCC 21838 / DSM 41398 / FERM P-419 / JCM 4703 / NBRC 107858) TaxID=1081613 RepID=A0A0B5ETB0_STRA4|nr:hypothetical protein SLNWT_4538 [Streptomyces albus]AOU79220.1 hypothetical protein SLNHY_4529 [Streptomyces albus]
MLRHPVDQCARDSAAYGMGRRVAGLAPLGFADAAQLDGRPDTR